jgi:diketogulonate reductase-like aldo/keto reductase
MLYRPLANTGLQISEVSLGCWPIAGMTSPGVTDADSIATIQACFDLGINHLDTAYCQIRENAGGSGWELDAEQLAEIDRALTERGTSATRLPV